MPDIYTPIDKTSPSCKAVYHMSDGKSIEVLTRMKPVFPILHETDIVVRYATVLL